jgi:hypothetical protein
MVALTPHQVLGILPSATAEQIHAAYRALAARLHPDVSGTPVTGEAMSRINAAYAALCLRPPEASASEPEPETSPAPAVRPESVNRPWSVAPSPAFVAAQYRAFVAQATVSHRVNLAG